MPTGPWHEAQIAAFASPLAASAATVFVAEKQKTMPAIVPSNRGCGRGRKGAFNIGFTTLGRKCQGFGATRGKQSKAYDASAQLDGIDIAEDVMRAKNLVRMMAAAAITVALSDAAVAQNSAKPPEPLIYFLDPQSAALLDNAEKGDFSALISRFVSEYQATFCGIASSVMALNALGIKRPTAPRWYPYNYWTQDNIFSSKVLKEVKPMSGVDADGITLEQLEKLLNLSGARAEKVFASDSGVDTFRKAARAAIADPDAILIVNFGRAEFGQAGIAGGGHISPVAAYNADADRFLVLDVARYKYLPSWATAERLFAAMNTPDSSSGKSRGYVIVRK